MTEESSHSDARVSIGIERAIRAAARAGNRLIAGGTARLDVDDTAARAGLRSALAAMGARILESTDRSAGPEDAGGGSAATARPTADFVFVDELPELADALLAGTDGRGINGRGTDGRDLDGRDLDGRGAAVGDGDAKSEAGGEPGAAGACREDCAGHVSFTRGLPAVIVDLNGNVFSHRRKDAESRIAWAAAGMPATAALAARLREAGTGRTPRIGVSLVLEPKTAAFARMLAAAGCEVAVFSSEAETDPEIAAALAGPGDVTVFAPQNTRGGADPEAVRREDARNAAGILDWAPELLIDDGSHLIRLAHSERRDALRTLAAAAEETTSGVRPLREMTAEGALTVPVIAVNDARTKTGFDNLIGTGQSCVFAILDLLDPPARTGADHGPYRGIAGTRWVVFGYGPVGVGTARFAAALGARVEIVERDPVRALAALHDGFEARTAEQSLPHADVVVSATGVWHTIDVEHLRVMKPGTVVAVAGGIDDEIAIDALVDEGWRSSPLGTGVTEWIAPGCAVGPRLLADGGGVNYTAGEGNPIEVMDLSFATQLAALIRLLGEDLQPGVHGIRAADEALVASAALAARGGRAEGATPRVRTGGAAQHWSVHRYRLGGAGAGPGDAKDPQPEFEA